MQLLSQKNAVITGGTAGIGKEIAILFAKNGANVAILGTNKERAIAVIRELESHRISSDQHFIYDLVDVSDFKEVENFINSVLSKWPKIDILVNNAGIVRDNLLMKMNEDEWDKVINVNLKSVYNTCKMVVRPMIRAKAGKIINITSVIGLMGNAGQSNYAASKSGMIGFTKSLAKELASRGICVNCIAPGFINTLMTEELSKTVKDLLISSIPMKKIGTPNDVAQSALFLASSLSDYITGQVLTVDGGMVM